MSTGLTAYDGDDADTEEEEDMGNVPPRGGRARTAAARAAARMAERSVSPEARAPHKRRRTAASFHPRGVRAGWLTQDYARCRRVAHVLRATRLSACPAAPPCSQCCDVQRSPTATCGH